MGCHLYEIHSFYSVVLTKVVDQWHVSTTTVVTKTRTGLELIWKWTGYISCVLYGILAYANSEGYSL